MLTLRVSKRVKTRKPLRVKQTHETQRTDSNQIETVTQ